MKIIYIYIKYNLHQVEATRKYFNDIYQIFIRIIIFINYFSLSMRFLFI
jgi:hypothetical protein